MPHDTDNGTILLDPITSPSGFVQAKALIRFYFGAQPTTFEEVARDWEQLFFCLKFDGKVKAHEAPPPVR